MILCIDIGNSFAKWAILEKALVKEKGVCPHAELGRFVQQILERNKANIEGWGLVNVSFPEFSTPIHHFLNGIPGIEIDSQTFLPIKNLYQTPATLGIDRITVAIGAVSIFEQGPLLVFDCGSALTWEFVNDKNEYIGGGISPGLNMRFRALHEFTARLPMVSLENQKPALSGINTENAIRSGVFNGLICEIEGIIEKYKEEQTQALKTIITGGDCLLLGNHVKNINFVDPDLLFKGIEFIVRSQKTLA